MSSIFNDTFFYQSTDYCRKQNKPHKYFLLFLFCWFDLFLLLFCFIWAVFQGWIQWEGEVNPPKNLQHPLKMSTSLPHHPKKHHPPQIESLWASAFFHLRHLEFRMCPVKCHIIILTLFGGGENIIAPVLKIVET